MLLHQHAKKLAAGGVFTWNGGIYSTYTKEEWDAMTEEEKEFVCRTC